MSLRTVKNPGRWLIALALGVLGVEVGLDAQRGRGAGAGPAAPPQPARQTAQLDLTGYWTTVVTDDWRVRMVTPAKGYYQGIPLSPDGRKVADAWDPAATASGEDACRAFGVGGLMRLPTRLHITWQDDWTLKIESDAGQQTRLLHFRPAATPATPAAVRTWQGNSVATWEKRRVTRTFGDAMASDGPGGLNVVTRDMRPGFLRKNGVPYSSQAVISEHFVRHADFGDEWFTVITTVTDPAYLNRPYVTSTSFRREPNGSKWNPTPCTVEPPL